MIAIINLILSIVVAIVAIYLLITWKKYSVNMKFLSDKDKKEDKNLIAKKRLDEIEERLWMLENPPLYKAGDKTPKGWTVYEVELKICQWVGYDWKYSLIKGNKKVGVYTKSTPDDLNIKNY